MVKSGDHASLFELADLYHHGSPYLAPNEAKARDLYTSAAKAGNAEAQYHCGKFLRLVVQGVEYTATTSYDVPLFPTTSFDFLLLPTTFPIHVLTPNDDLTSHGPNSIPQYQFPRQFRGEFYERSGVVCEVGHAGPRGSEEGA